MTIKKKPFSKPKQQVMPFPALETPLAQACDKHLAAMQSFERAKKELNDSAADLVAKIKASKRAQVRHAGRFFVAKDIAAQTKLLVKDVQTQ